MQCEHKTAVIDTYKVHLYRVSPLELHANRRHTKESFVAKTKGGIRNVFPEMCEGIT